MKVVLFGATGMIGAGALLECLADPRVTSVLAIVRAPSGRTHAKLREIVHADFFNFETLRAEFACCDACFFCLGVSAAGMSEEIYSRVTYDVTLAAARVLAEANPKITFCYISGEGADSTGHGRIMWARVKGRIENAILGLPFKASFMFRPAFILPMKGVRSRTGWYQAFYTIASPIYPVLRWLFPKLTTTTVNLGRAMIEVAVRGCHRPILQSVEINALARQS